MHGTPCVVSLAAQMFATHSVIFLLLYILFVCFALLCSVVPHILHSRHSQRMHRIALWSSKKRGAQHLLLCINSTNQRDCFFLDFFAATEEREATDKNCKRAWIYGGSSVNHKAMFFIISMMGFAVLRQRIRTSYRPLHIIRQSTICVSMAYDAYISGIPPQWPSINYGFWLCTLTLSITH